METTQFKKVIKTSDLSPGHSRLVELNGESIALFNVEGIFYAVANDCLHRGAPLHEGELRKNVVVCPWHGWQFDVKTGSSLVNPEVFLKKYNVHIEGDDVCVALP